jgi:hypothetical protein
MGAHPADYLIDRLGGQVLVDGVIGFDAANESTTSRGEVSLYLSCLAPDETTATGIVAEVERYLRAREAGDGARSATPWKAYTGGLGYSTFSGLVERNGRTVTFDRGNFFQIADGCPGLLAYLRAKGCTDIQYSFSEEREEHGPWH